MKVSLSRRFLLITAGIITLSTLVSYLIFYNVMRDRYIENFTDEMDKAELVLTDYLDNRFSILNSGIGILKSDPRFLASIAEGDPETAQNEIADFRDLINADFLIIMDQEGTVLAKEQASDVGEDLSLSNQVQTLRSNPAHSYLASPQSVYQCMDTDIVLGAPVGQLVAGYAIDDEVLNKLEQLTACGVLLLVDGTAVGTSTHAPQQILEGIKSFEPSGSGPISGKVYTQRYAGEDFLVLFHFLGGRDDWSLVLTRSLGDQLDAAMARIARLLIMAFVVTIVLSLISISLFITRNLGMAIDRLVTATKNIARGHLADPVMPHRHDELGMLASNFEEMRQELIKNRDALDQSQKKRLQAERLATVGNLTSGIIHDFKSKMTVISLAMQSISRGKLDPDKQRQYAQKVNNQVAEMVNLTQEILDFSRGKKTLTLTELDVPTYLLGHLSIHKENFDRNSIDLSYSLPEGFMARLDAHRFQRVLNNILNNAYEALTPGQRIQVTLSEEGEYFTLQIQDNGIGIPQDLLPTLFEPFVTHGKSKGTGLGLAISQKIVEDHGGSIEVESQENKGTSFTIRMPKNLSI